MGASRNNALDLVLDNIRRFAALPRGRNRLSFGSAVGFVITPRPGGERPRRGSTGGRVFGVGGTSVAGPGAGYWAAGRAGRAPGPGRHYSRHPGGSISANNPVHESGAAGRGR